MENEEKEELKGDEEEKKMRPVSAMSGICATIPPNDRN
jgi:hypothetical protein